MKSFIDKTKELQIFYKFKNLIAIGFHIFLNGILFIILMIILKPLIAFLLALPAILPLYKLGQYFSEILIPIQTNAIE
jgi:hypothetical protein